MWSVPKSGAYARWIEAQFIPGYRAMKGVHERLSALESAGLIHWRSTGTPRLKRYLSASKGEAVSDLIVDIQNVNNRSKEYVSYPTQKPLALLERIIKASSNEGDVVLDPFCGCATALVSAEKLNRQWIGIDLSALAVKLVLSRLQQAADDGALLHGGKLPEVHHRTDIPQRTDVDKLPPYKTHRHTLYGKQEGLCAGCLHHFPFRNLTVDHIVPQSKGGTDHLDNLQLLCGACNSTKGTMDQAAFVAKLSNRESGTKLHTVSTMSILIPSSDELIMKPKRTKPREVELPHQHLSAKSSGATRGYSCGCNLREVVEAVLRPVKIRYVKSPKREK